jgi:hypothetical protein
VQRVVLSSDKLACLPIGPELVLVVWVHIQAALLRALPVRRYAIVDVRLVNDLGNQLRSVVYGARVWRREFAAEDSIFATGSDKQAQQGPHTVHCEAEHDHGDEYEYGDASPHSGCSALSSPFLGCSQRGPGGGSSTGVASAIGRW